MPLRFCRSLTVGRAVHDVEAILSCIFHLKILRPRKGGKANCTGTLAELGVQVGV